jgi:hypothetical protein
LLSVVREGASSAATLLPDGTIHTTRHLGAAPVAHRPFGRCLIDSTRQFPPVESMGTASLCASPIRELFVRPTRCWNEASMPIATANNLRYLLVEETPETDTALVLETPTESIVIGSDGFRIGASPVCELFLADGPALHSVIRRQAGVTWIETADDASLLINGRSCRRMALRDGDVLEMNGIELTVRFRTVAADEEIPLGFEDDPSLLSAEELCDRIVAEQTAVDEFEKGCRQGWNSLMAAIEATCEAEAPTVTLPLDAEPLVEAPTAPDDCDRLLAQIHELSEMMNGRTRELDDCENELVAAAALLQEAQDKVSQQIEGLLDQINLAPQETELRASA